MSAIPPDAAPEEQQGQGDGQARGPRDSRPTSVLAAVQSGQRERDDSALWDHLNEKLNAAG